MAPAEGAVPADPAATPLFSLLPDLLLSPPVTVPALPLLLAWSPSPPVEGAVPSVDGVPLPFEPPALEPAGLVLPEPGSPLFSAGQLEPDVRWPVPISKQRFSRHHEVRSVRRHVLFVR